MLKDRFFQILLAALLLLYVLHLWGLYGGGYRDIRTLDVATHFLGGVFVGGILVWYFFRRIPHAYLIGILSALVIGVAWEIFEVYADPSYPSISGYVFDTTKDLVMDTVGGFSAAYLFLRLWKKK